MIMTQTFERERNDFGAMEGARISTHGFVVRPLGDSVTES